MSAYVIVEIEIHNRSLYKEYTELTPSTIKAFNGRFVVRGGKTKVLEGDWNPKRIVVLEFPSADMANSWWNSKEYSSAREKRQQAASTRMIIVEGV